MSHYPISPYGVSLSKQHESSVAVVVYAINHLSDLALYQDDSASIIPAIAKQSCSQHAVMMGYDFHLTQTVPQLIEVNTNAGGLWLACLAGNLQLTSFPNRLAQRVVMTFMQTYCAFYQNPQATLRHLVIIDDNPAEQFLFAEMQQFANLFRQVGISCAIADPRDIERRSDGLYLHQQRIDMLYNRHCDFYLESHSMQDILQAWLNHQVCLSPNPYAYALFADKQNLIAWSHKKQLDHFGMPARQQQYLLQSIPTTHWLNSFSFQENWTNRKQWVFKPLCGYGSRGVYVGDKLTKNKLEQLSEQKTLIQRYIQPSTTSTPIGDFKTDFRLFVYRKQILAVAARLYSGQVTNLRTEYGGFAHVTLL